MAEILDIQQGSDGSITVTVVDGNGDPLDASSGWTVLAQARPSATSSTLWAEWSSSPTGSQSTAVPGNGSVVLDFTAAESSAWTSWAGHTAVIGVQLTETAGDQREVELITWARLRPEVVRPS